MRATSRLCHREENLRALVTRHWVGLLWLGRRMFWSWILLEYFKKASYFVNAFRCYSDWHLRNTEDRQIKGFQMHPLWIFNTEILHCPLMKTNHLCKGKTVFPLISLTEDVGIYSVSDSILNLISLPFVVSSYLTWQALILYIPLFFFFFTSSKAHLFWNHHAVLFVQSEKSFLSEDSV